MVMGDITAGVGIVGVTGANGAGKTLVAVHCALVRMRAGVIVYSTVPIDDGQGHVSLPILSMRQLLELRDCTVLLDEVAVIFSARSTASMPSEVVAFLQTARHRKVSIIWTAPAWMRCDNQLRDATQASLNVHKLGKIRNGTPWPRARLVALTLMDTVGVKKDAPPTQRLKSRIARPGGLLSFGAYDSYADTPQIAAYTLTGVCVDCGGTMTRPKHTPERHAALGIPFYEGDVNEAVAAELGREEDFHPLGRHPHDNGVHFAAAPGEAAAEENLEFIRMVSGPPD